MSVSSQADKYKCERSGWLQVLNSRKLIIDSLSAMIVSEKDNSIIKITSKDFSKTSTSYISSEKLHCHNRKVGHSTESSTPVKVRKSTDVVVAFVSSMSDVFGFTQADLQTREVLYRPHVPIALYPLY